MNGGEKRVAKRGVGTMGGKIEWVALIGESGQRALPIGRGCRLGYGVEGIDPG